ncbi:hypothetical protein AnaeK_4430 [Anaeromyxobacter sp. K]|uniref:hypothetical protein n=1 Tax=Anaeromyxobacter sp. (strain K) TaxID=447217 RepID=UPI00015F9162|nr:hypothetical protein [Anaeromyxobacter sp. K]ACG75633.1 hypothetical protein AnaeK_4430 [Anaeromyxobacter sp. K]
MRCPEAFAAEIGRHPGIVVGRLQHDRHLPFKNLRAALVPVREHLLSQGWGEVPASATAP